MCVSAAAAVGIASALFTTSQIIDERQTQRNTISALEEQNRINNRQAADQQTALNLQQTQARDQAVNRQLREQLQAANEASSVRTAAAESGITGVGVNRQVGQIGQALSSDLGIIERNLAASNAQINNRLDASHRGLISQNNQLDREVAGPGLLDSLVRIGAAYIGGASAGGQFFGPAATLGEGAARVGTLFASPSTFMTFADEERVRNAQATGFSEDFLSGGFINRDLARSERSLARVRQRRSEFDAS